MLQTYLEDRLIIFKGKDERASKRHKVKLGRVPFL